MLAEDAYDVLQQSYDVALRADKNIEKMYEQGLVAEYDKIRADVSVKNIKPQLTQMQNSVELTKMMLKVLLSLPVDMQIQIDGSLADMEGTMMNEILLSRFDLSENSDLLTLDLNLKKLQQQKALINTQRMPMLAAFSQFTPTTQANDKAFDDARWNYPLAAGLQLQVPLWDIYAKQRQVNQVKIGIEQIKIQKDYLKQNLSVQAQNSVNKMIQAKEQLESNKEAVTQAQKGLDISQVRYDTGVGTILELNDAQMALVQSKLNYTQAIYDFLISKFELEKLLGNI
jgi:outer membrane protein TolC